jgi:hypothetical protein
MLVPWFEIMISLDFDRYHYICHYKCQKAQEDPELKIRSEARGGSSISLDFTGFSSLDAFSS